MAVSRNPHDSGAAAWPAVATPELGLWMFLATVTMLFAGFSSAYVVRQTTGSDWRAVPLPRLLWLTTALLLTCSLALERARGPSVAGVRRISRAWLIAAAGLAVAFLAGQVAAWRELAAAGFGVGSTPHGSFFYVLSAAHGVHVIGGLAALAYALLVAGRARAERTLKLCATYWHFLAALWLYVLALLVFFG